MKIDITAFVKNADPFEFSASRMARGENAGPETWRNANTEAVERPLLHTKAQLYAMRDWMKESGAWDKAERAAMSDTELNALFIQLISGDIREAEELCGDSMDSAMFDWREYEDLAEQGTINGNIWRNEAGSFFYDLD